jgi:hypothetical protein
MGQHITIEWIQAGIVDVGRQHAFPQIVQNDDSRGSAKPPKSLLTQLCPHPRA